MPSLPVKPLAAARAAPAAEVAPEPAPEPDPDAATQRRVMQRLVIDVVHDFDGWSIIDNLEGLIAAAGDALTATVDLDDDLGDELGGQLRTRQTTVALLLSSDAEVRLLNAKWRGIDKATNVLSFPAPAAVGDLEQVHSLGDIALACETIVAEAADLGTSPAHHLQHLVVHGLLHLLGYDHQNPADANEMEELEVDILARLGIADPYIGSDLVGVIS
jgi:probable rRNA maturation factor